MFIPFTLEIPPSHLWANYKAAVGHQEGTVSVWEWTPSGPSTEKDLPPRCEYSHSPSQAPEEVVTLWLKRKWQNQMQNTNNKYMRHNCTVKLWPFIGSITCSHKHSFLLTYNNRFFRKLKSWFWITDFEEIQSKCVLYIFYLMSCLCCTDINKVQRQDKPIIKWRHCHQREPVHPAAIWI